MPPPGSQERSIGGENLHPMVIVVSDVDPAPSVHRNVIWGTELPLAKARTAPLGQQRPVGGEALHTVINVGHQEGAIVVDHDPAIGLENWFLTGAVSAKLHEEHTVCVERLDVSPPVVADIDAAIRTAGNSKCPLKLTIISAAMAPRGDELPIRVELLDAVVAGIGHEEVAHGIKGDGTRRVAEQIDEIELPFAAAWRAPDLEERSVWGKDLKAAVATISHPEMAIGVDGQLEGVPEGKIGAARGVPKDLRHGGRWCACPRCRALGQDRRCCRADQHHGRHEETSGERTRCGAPHRSVREVLRHALSWPGPA